MRFIGSTTPTCLAAVVCLGTLACQQDDAATARADESQRHGSQAQPSRADERHARDEGNGQAAQQPLLLRPELDHGPPEPLRFRPEDIPWQPGPASFEPGAEYAVLEGDPSAPGVFTMQIRMPDGFQIKPHWHPNVERITVLQGVFRLGHGSEMDPEAAGPLPAGSYTSMPKRMIHHVFIEGETIVQLSSIGPWEIHYVRPEDDPRKRR
jgi:hypothetical protein